MPLQKIFLPDEVKQHRLTMAKHILHHEPHGDDVGWWLRNVV